MKINIIGKAGSLFITTIERWWNRDPFREGAIIAYNAIFALPGLLVVVIALTSHYLGEDAVSGQLHRQIAEAMGNDTADQIQAMVVMSMKSKDSMRASIIGLAVMIIGATAVFVELQKSLNIIWEVKATTAKSGILKFLKTRLFSFGLILSIAFLLLVSLVLASLVSAFSLWIQNYWSASLLVFFKVFNLFFSLGITTILFALMFKTIPDARIKWRSVWLGAFMTSLLFFIGKSILVLYFGKSNPGSVYGAAGSIILILLWTAYSSMIVFFGAEFTKVYSDYYEGEVTPSETAIKQKGRIK